MALFNWYICQLMPQLVKYFESIYVYILYVEVKNSYLRPYIYMCVCVGQMYAEMQVVSPLVPTREAHFLRYCQQNAEEGTWAIVDFPIDSFHHNLQPSFPRYNRRPSGCLIQDMPNGYSRVSSIFFFSITIY